MTSHHTRPHTQPNIRRPMLSYRALATTRQAMLARSALRQFSSSGLDVTPATRRNNFLVAGACASFVTGVWYYSVSAVGGFGAGEVDELEGAIREEEVKINIHQSGELRARGGAARGDDNENQIEEKKGRGWKFWQKKA